MGRYLVTLTRTDRCTIPWRSDVELIDEVDYVDSRVNVLPARLRNLAQRWFEFQFSMKMLLSSRKYSGFAIGRCTIWLPILLRLLGRKKPVVLTDTEWRGGSGTINRLACLSSKAVTAFSREEIRRYSSRFRIPEEKFFWQPAIYPKILDTSDAGYVFAGGNQARDWPTFIQAVSSLSWPVRVFTTYRFGSVPPHIQTSLPVSMDEFYHQIANASCVVVPTVAEPLRITGMLTWVAAMAHGKVLICTEPEAAQDYFENGVSGFWVEHGDVAALRRTIDMVMRDAQLRARVGKAAQERALREFSLEKYRKRILQLLAGEIENGSCNSESNKLTQCAVP